MFSRRTPSRYDLNPLARALEKARQMPGDILDLTVSNPQRAGIIPPENLVLAPLQHGGAIHYEPDPHGLPLARSAVSTHLARRGIRSDPEKLFLTASTSEAYGFLLKLLCDPGDAVLAPEPSYPLLDHLLDLESIRRVPYRIAYENGWKLDLDSIGKVLADSSQPRIRAIVIVSPNNPTGNYLKRNELDHLAELALRHELALVSDEVFFDYRLGDPAPGSISLASGSSVPAFTLGGLSKTLGLPQMKLAWIIVNGPKAWLPGCLERLELIADTYLSVGTPVQLAAGTWLEAEAIFQKPIHERVRGNWEMLQHVFSGAPGQAELLPAEGGWYAMLRVPRYEDDGTMAVSLLEHERVLVQPGYFYDCHAGAHFVVSLLTEPGVLKQGTGRLIDGLRRIGG